MSRTTPEECSCRKRRKPYSMVKDDNDDEIDDEDVDDGIVMTMLMLDSF